MSKKNLAAALMEAKPRMNEPRVKQLSGVLFKCCEDIGDSEDTAITTAEIAEKITVLIEDGAPIGVAGLIQRALKEIRIEDENYEERPDEIDYHDLKKPELILYASPLLPDISEEELNEHTMKEIYELIENIN